MTRIAGDMSPAAAPRRAESRPATGENQPFERELARAAAPETEDRTDPDLESPDSAKPRPRADENKGKQSASPTREPTSDGVDPDTQPDPHSIPVEGSAPAQLGQVAIPVEAQLSLEPAIATGDADTGEAALAVAGDADSEPDAAIEIDAELATEADVAPEAEAEAEAVAKLAVDTDADAGTTEVAARVSDDAAPDGKASTTAEPSADMSSARNHAGSPTTAEAARTNHASGPRAAPTQPALSPEQIERMLDQQISSNRARFVIGEGDDRLAVTVRMGANNVRILASAGSGEHAARFLAGADELAASLGERGLTLDLSVMSDSAGEGQAHDRDPNESRGGADASVPELAPAATTNDHRLRGVRAVA